MSTAEPTDTQGGQQAASQREEQLAQAAARIWRGRTPRLGLEKVADLSLLDPTLVCTLPDQQFHALDNGLEVAVDHKAHQLRVRRTRRVGKAEPGEEESHLVEVYGDHVARERNRIPAYQRMVSTRQVTFTCAWCNTSVTQHRYPSRGPRYCSQVCQQEANRERTRQRVQRLRERQRVAKAAEA